MSTFTISHNLNFILDQLIDVEGLTVKKDFGAISFHLQDHLIGAIIGGKFRLRLPGCTRSLCGDIHSISIFDRITQNDSFFREVPEEVLENKEELTNWVARAYEAALM